MADQRAAVVIRRHLQKHEPFLLIHLGEGGAVYRPRVEDGGGEWEPVEILLKHLMPMDVSR